MGDLAVDLEKLLVSSTSHSQTLTQPILYDNSFVIETDISSA